jgi:hypothetical protein
MEYCIESVQEKLAAFGRPLGVGVIKPRVRVIVVEDYIVRVVVGNISHRK